VKRQTVKDFFKKTMGFNSLSLYAAMQDPIFTAAI
jgi:hypothetical protein